MAEVFNDDIQNHNKLYISRASRISKNSFVDLLNDSSLILEKEEKLIKSNSPLKRTKLLDISELNLEDEIDKEEDVNKTISTIPVFERYFLILPNKHDNFIEDFVHEINKARVNIPKYSKKIKDLSRKIETDSSKEKYLVYKKEKISIIGGTPAFINCSINLYDLNNKLKKDKTYLQEIKLIDELKMPFPEDLKDWEDDYFITQSMKNLEKKVRGRYNLKEFISKKCEIMDGEISAILSIINEENNNDGKNIFFSKEINYIGINIKKIEQNSIILYINFGN